MGSSSALSSAEFVVGNGEPNRSGLLRVVRGALAKRSLEVDSTCVLVSGHYFAMNLSELLEDDKLDVAISTYEMRHFCVAAMSYCDLLRVLPHEGEYEEAFEEGEYPLIHLFTDKSACIREAFDFMPKVYDENCWHRFGSPAHCWTLLSTFEGRVMLEQPE